MLGKAGDPRSTPCIKTPPCCSNADPRSRGILTIQTGLPVARIELLDEVQVRAVNAHAKLTLPESPLLLLEFHGTESGVREQAERFGEYAARWS